MALADVNLFQVLKTKMKWHHERQSVLAQNIANADTPNYKSKDLSPFRVESSAAGGTSIAIAQTNSKHLGLNAGSGRHGQNSLEERAQSSFEVRPSGNAISLDEQMAKISENSMGYYEAAALMRRVVSMYRTATSKGR